MDISILDKKALIILVSISENHSQLLRPSYTPKSHDYGIDRVSDELSSPAKIAMESMWNVKLMFVLFKG